MTRSDVDNTRNTINSSVNTRGSNQILASGKVFSKCALNDWVLQGFWFTQNGFCLVVNRSIFNIKRTCSQLLVSARFQKPQHPFSRLAGKVESYNIVVVTGQMPVKISAMYICLW